MSLACFIAALLPGPRFDRSLFSAIFLCRRSLPIPCEYVTAALGGAGLHVLGERLRLRMAGYVLAAGLILALGWQTWNRVFVFQNDTRLWTSTVDLNPQAWIAQSNLGILLIKETAIREALLHLERSLELNPRNELTLYNLGLLYTALCKPNLAIRYFNLALAERPDGSMIHGNLGVALKMAGRVEEGIDAFQKAIALDPKNGMAIQNLAETGSVRVIAIRRSNSGDRPSR